MTTECKVILGLLDYPDRWHTVNIYKAIEHDSKLFIYFTGFEITQPGHCGAYVILPWYEVLLILWKARRTRRLIGNRSFLDRTESSQNLDAH